MALIRAVIPEQAAGIAELCNLGGIATLEITFTVPEHAALSNHLGKTFSGKFRRKPSVLRLSPCDYFFTKFVNNRTARATAI